MRYDRAVLLFVVATLLGLPATAKARPGYVTFAGSRTLEFNLKGSNGYAIEVALLNQRHIHLLASNSRSVVVYLPPPARRNDDRIEANFPGVGHISMRFRAVGPERREASFFPACQGGEIVEQPGYFEGIAHLRGERGYTAVDATRAKGQIVTRVREVCKQSMFDDSNPQPKEDSTQLFAYSQSEGRTVSFVGSTTRIPSASFTSTFFSGQIFERRAGMRISRVTTVNGKPSELLPSGSTVFPQSATVTPPGPFHGSATFQRIGNGDNSWTGTLSAPFPGKGMVTLAGQDFSARLKQCIRCAPKRGNRRLSRPAP